MDEERLIGVTLLGCAAFIAALTVKYNRAYRRQDTT